MRCHWRWLLTIVLSAVLHVAQAHAADHEPERYSLSLDARFGVATAPFFTRAFPRVRGHGFVLLPAASYRLNDRIVVGVRVPIAMISVAQPAGSYVDVYTWGNPKFWFEQRQALWHDTRFRLEAMAGAAIGLPIAQHGPAGSMLALRALQLASAFDGFREQDLYSAGCLPLAGSYGIRFEGRRAGFDVALRVPLFIRFSRAELSSDADPRSVAIAPVFDTGAHVTATRWLAFSLSADTVFNSLAPVAPERSATPSTQFSLTPAIDFALSHSLRLSARYLLPVAGPLGGHAGAGGLELVFAPGH